MRRHIVIHNHLPKRKTRDGITVEYIAKQGEGWVRKVMRFDGINTAQASAKSMASRSDVKNVTVYDKDGRPVWSSSDRARDEGAMAWADKARWFRGEADREEKKGNTEAARKYRVPGRLR